MFEGVLCLVGQYIQEYEQRCILYPVFAVAQMSEVRCVRYIPGIRSSSVQYGFYCGTHVIIIERYAYHHLVTIRQYFTVVRSG